MRSGWGIICIIAGLGCGAGLAIAQTASDATSPAQESPAQSAPGQAAPGEAAPGQAAPEQAAPIDPNVELRDKLAKIRKDNDDLAARLKELQLLIGLNVCDPATKSKIEALFQQASLAPPADAQMTPMAAEVTDTNTAGIVQQSLRTPPDAAAIEPGSKPLDQKNLLKLLNSMTVLVITPNALGSGIVVAPNLVLTNRHVVEEAKERNATQGQNEGQNIVVMSKSAAFALQAKVVATSENSDFNREDFALLSVDGRLPPVAPQLAAEPQPLDRVIAAGYPGTVISNDQNFLKLMKGGAGDAPDLVLSSGIINTVQNSDSAVPVIVHTADIAPGSSGGPLVNSCGQIVGINTFLRKGDAGTARFAISADVIGRFLSAHKAALPVGAKCGANAG